MRRMAILLALLFIAGCAPAGTTMDERLRQQALASATSEFERVCYQNGHMWMPMLPHSDGVPVGDDACYGCMPDADNHICDMQEYLDYIN